MATPEMILLLALAALPTGYYVWREMRSRSAQGRWPRTAQDLGFRYSDSPPALAGQWKGRNFIWTAETDRGVAVLRGQLDPSQVARLEIGPKAELEREAGMVVPDRVTFPDRSGTAFEELCVARVTPVELGTTMVDIGLRRRLAAHPGLRILAGNGRLELRSPLLLQAREMREVMDIAVSVAEAMESLR